MRVKIPLLAAACIVLLGGCEAKENQTEVKAIASRTAPSAIASDLPVRGAFPDAREVRLFVETGQKSNGNPAYAEPNGRILTKAQRDTFESTLQIDPIPDALAACFIPHHFFKYYDSQGKELGQIEVCFCCAGVRASQSSQIAIGPDQWLSADFGKLERFIASLKLPTVVQCD